MSDAGNLDVSNFSDSYFRNACLFYMKLQEQHVNPASISQSTAEEIQNILELGPIRRGMD